MSAIALTEHLPRHAEFVNDIHSALNPTRVARVFKPDRIEQVCAIVRQANQARASIAIAGGRHAMGGQQFATDSWLLDMSAMDRIIAFDPGHGRIEVEAGIQWPELIKGYLDLQYGMVELWGIAQKQTGADRLSIGGSIAANIHGRGLQLQPFGQDIVDLTVVDAEGRVHCIDRSSNPEWFSLIVGGYGLFGIVVRATLQLVRRQKLRRVVETLSIESLMPRMQQRVDDGFLYGDFQFAIDPESDEFLREGILSCYQPVDASTPMQEEQAQLSAADWRQLLYLAHTDKQAAFAHYRKFYLRSSGQLYWSDTHQLSLYLDDYHSDIDAVCQCPCVASEMITEMYVPRDRLSAFMADVRADFRRHNVDLIYGTIRLIERDEDSFLAWARESFACVIFNLHTEHSGPGIAHSADAFRRLIDMAIAHGGSYFLTYHRFASREQVMACHPRFEQFLRLKEKYDPDLRFQSDWYRHQKALFDDQAK